MRWVGKIVIGVFAAAGLAVAGLALSLWLAARPVLDSALAQYAALPAVAHCEAPHVTPPGYPASVRPVETIGDAEDSVYRATCEAEGLTGSCFYVNGAPRQLGFRLYRRAYLSDCELNAVSLHGDTRLRHALELLYPDLPVTSLGEEEMTCVARAMRTGHGGFCARNPSCCPAAASE